MAWIYGGWAKVSNISDISDEALGERKITTFEFEFDTTTVLYFIAYFVIVTICCTGGTEKQNGFTRGGESSSSFSAA